MAAAWTVCFYASEVAALLGRHRYRPRGLALLLALNHQTCWQQEELRLAICRDPLLRQSIERERGRLPFDDRALESAERGALSTADVEYNLANVAEQRRSEAARLSTLAEVGERRNAAISAAYVIAARDLQSKRPPRRRCGLFRWASARLRRHRAASRVEALRAVANSAAHEAAALRRPGEVVERAPALKLRAARLEGEAARLDDLRNAPPEELRAVAQREATMRRGVAQEAAVLDGLHPLHGPVGERNERVYTLDVAPGVRVVGKIDGKIKNGRVVEAKTRKNWFREPPDYDVVQLQVYLRMLGEASGLLVEEQQNGERRRETEVRAEDLKWEAAARELRRMADEVRGATMETARAWMR